MREIQCDIAIIGGGMGGVAALIHTVDEAGEVALTCDTDWLGGQITAQGVSALDEHQFIEQFGGTASYMALRDKIREHYQLEFDAPSTLPETVHGKDVPLNPGNGWVSRLCFDPRVALWYMPSADGHILPNTEPISVERDGDTVKAVIMADENGDEVRINAKYFLDATELGDLLPLADIPYVTGAEAKSDTGEADAPDEVRPTEVQSFTYCFMVEYCAGEDHTIAKPDGYEYFRDHQPYSLTIYNKQGEPQPYRVFERSEGRFLPFWTYRRIHDGEMLGGNDIALMNWHGNDYYGGNIIDVSSEEKATFLDEAKRLSLGFLYWLQTECPRDDGGYGYPEFKLRPDIMGTADGLSKAPYIREARRIKPLTRIVQHDLAAETNPGARARLFPDSVGLGWYAMDLHPCVGNPKVSMYDPTKPFQIPLGALLPEQPTNVIAACKNIGTTHLTNGAYRLHPTEWNIGASAGALVAFCLENGCTPHDVQSEHLLLWRFQYRLVSEYGVPIFWAIDMPLSHSLFVPAQIILVRDVIVKDSPRWHTLDILPDQPLGDDFDLDKLRLIDDELQLDMQIDSGMTFAGLCERIAPALGEFLV